MNVIMLQFALVLFDFWTNLLETIYNFSSTHINKYINFNPCCNDTGIQGQDEAYRAKLLKNT